MEPRSVIRVLGDVMFPSFTGCGPQIGLPTIERLEGSLGVRLPESYRAFLLLVNGGRPNPPYFFVRGHDEEEFSVHYFYGLDCEERSYDLHYTTQLDKKIFEEKLITIASTETNDILALRTGDPEGAIYFCDALSTQGAKLTDVGMSFREFMTSFHFER